MQPPARVPVTVTYETVIAGKVGFDDLDVTKEPQAPADWGSRVASVFSKPAEMSAHEKLILRGLRLELTSQRIDRLHEIRRALTSRFGGEPALLAVIEAAPRELQAQARQLLQMDAKGVEGDQVATHLNKGLTALSQVLKEYERTALQTHEEIRATSLLNSEKSLAAPVARAYAFTALARALVTLPPGEQAARRAGLNQALEAALADGGTSTPALIDRLIKKAIEETPAGPQGDEFSRPEDASSLLSDDEGPVRLHAGAGSSQAESSGTVQVHMKARKPDAKS